MPATINKTNIENNQKTIIKYLERTFLSLNFLNFFTLIHLSYSPKIYDLYLIEKRGEKR
jgi:hypothetical protein